MAHITLQSPGQPVADFSVSGASIVIAGAAVDCAALQDNAQVVVNVRRDKTGVTKISGKTGAYIAQIFIPGKQYVDQPGPVDAQGQPTVVPVAQPLDPNTIAVTLWPTV